MSYRVDLDIFSGPMDLLLYLIRKDEVDIYDIPISRVTEQYMRYIDMLKDLDIDLACDFLIMAATLMQIKSAMLLPKVDAEEISGDPEDPRSELIRQLLEYKRYKDAANLLSSAAEQQTAKFVRPAAILNKLKPDSEPELDLDQVSIWDLLEAFDTIMRATGSRIDFRQITDDTPIDLYQIEILHRLQTEGSMTFARIFEKKSGRMALVGFFLALLELVRDKLVWIEQDEQSCELFLKALTDEPAEEAVHNTMLMNSRLAATDVGQDQAALTQESDISIENAIAESENDEPEQAESLAIPIMEVMPKETKEQSETEQSEVRNESYFG